MARPEASILSAITADVLYLLPKAFDLSLKVFGSFFKLGELWLKLGDDGLRKAAYRGG